MTPIIEVQDIAKTYRIRHQHQTGRDLDRRSLQRLRRPIEAFLGRGLDYEAFWALKGVSFEVNQGDIVGIIGKNGSGKSTLLKILSRIVEPTRGKAVLRGKISSLLEVGTGFHPELSGRENIFLNGAILGMTQNQIKRNFDEIVDFAGVERFLDTPVKFYSSGMYVRLAFAVAAHLEPDILIIDEVLAVGDSEFQRKSLGKMNQVATEGRTILFVSHNMDSIETLCQRGILLEEGAIKVEGGVSEVVAIYSQGRGLEFPLAERKDREGSGRVIWTGLESAWHPEEKALRLKMTYENPSRQSFPNVKVSVAIHDTASGRVLANVTNNVLNQRIDLAEEGGEMRLSIFDVNLETSLYSLELFLAADSFNTEILDWVEQAGTIAIDNSDFYDTGHVPPSKTTVLYRFQYEV
jgi:lipopolysaccharide transport system ATP-binding protein